MPFIILQRVELTEKDESDYYDGALEQGDSKAHEWQVRVMQNHKTANLTGYSAVCYGVREDGKTVSTAAKIEGNTVRALLDSGFYSVTGALVAQMVLSRTDGTTVTIATLNLGVRRTRTGELVTSDERIVDLDGMMAILEETKAAAQAATAAAAAANAAAQSANFVVLGRYETLALLQAAHPAGSAGDAWSVGEAEPYDVYIWDVDKAAWESIGPLAGAKGEPGVGIAQIARTAGDGSAGSVDTYTISYTDGTSTTYMVRNGANGKDGKDGKDAQAFDQSLNTTDAVTFASVTADVVYGAVFME